MNKIELDKATVQLIEKDIVLISIKENQTIEIEDVKKIRTVSLEISNSKKYVTITEAASNTSVSKNAREFAAQANSLDSHRLSIALITRNLAQRLLTNFYLKVNKPSTPTKSFPSLKEALHWSKKQLNQ